MLSGTGGSPPPATPLLASDALLWRESCDLDDDARACSDGCTPTAGEPSATWLQQPMGMPAPAGSGQRAVGSEPINCGAAPGGGGVSPAVSQSSARDAAIRLWEKEPTLFESSRSGLCRTLSALAVLQSSGWTWFAATSYGPMAAPLAEGGWQMSYWLTSTVLTISYGFLAGAYLYSTRYVCRLRISDRAPPPPPPLPPASAAGLTAHRRRPQPPKWR